MTTEVFADPSAEVVGRRRFELAPMLAHAALMVLSLFTVLPIVWMYLSSLRPPNLLFGNLLSLHPSLDNYKSALDQLPFGPMFLNTLAMAVGVSLGQLLTGLFAAYAFSNWHFRGQRILFLLVVATWLVPFQVTMLPNYVLLSHLGLLNTVAGVVVPQLASAFSVLLLRQHLKGFPSELLEAARADGMSSWAILWKVVVPNIIPSLAALEILLFVGSWNEYFWPLLVLHGQTLVLQLGISRFLDIDAANYGALLAAGGLATIPLLVVYLFLQRRVVNAFVRSGLR
jgi:ABC-type glycerol-3-phosphate transport system permease component